MSTRCGNLQRDWKYQDLAKALHWIVPLLSSSLMLFSVCKKPRLLFDWNDTVKGIYGLLLYFPFGKVSKECLCKENHYTENHLIFCFPIHNDGILLTMWSIWWAILYFFKLQNKQTNSNCIHHCFFFFLPFPDLVLTLSQLNTRIIIPVAGHFCGPQSPPAFQALRHLFPCLSFLLCKMGII